MFVVDGHNLVLRVLRYLPYSQGRRQHAVGFAGRELLEEFESELEHRRDAGKLSKRSMRMEFRPALVLLALEDADGIRLPNQAELEHYLAKTPGRRAAMSTFVGFLKVNRGIDLRLPAKAMGNSPVAR